MRVTTKSALTRMQPDWKGPRPLEPEDVYSMQLLHCYDVISGRPSPWEHLFTQDDWLAFEYLRDAKYHYSEGFGGVPPTGMFAVPWLRATMDVLSNSKEDPDRFPLKIAFTHREELLYLCVLLKIGEKPGWTPDLDKVDMERLWRVGQIAPYLGHCGLETYLDQEGDTRLRIIVNGSVFKGFGGSLRQDEDGGYGFDTVSDWVKARGKEWDAFKGGELSFLRD